MFCVNLRFFPALVGRNLRLMEKSPSRVSSSKMTFQKLLALVRPAKTCMFREYGVVARVGIIRRYKIFSGS